MVDKQLTKKKLTKKQLEIVLSKLKAPSEPKESLEQYTIPSDLAAEILNIASLNGDIEGKTVFDFGCGSGRLAIGAALLGAKKTIGIDVDKDLIRLAEENAKAADVEIEFVNERIEDFSGECNTVLQNPPFGMRGEKSADRGFLAKALDCIGRGGRVYSLHRGGYEGESGYKFTREFLTRFIESNKGRVLSVKEFKFGIPHMFKFHKKPKVSYNVDLFVIEKS